MIVSKETALDSVIDAFFSSVFNVPEKTSKDRDRESKGDTYYQQTAQIVHTNAGRDNKTVCYTIINNVEITY